MTSIEQQQKKSIRRLASWLTVGVIAMFAFGYALVPLYNTMCKVLGINGKTGSAVVAAEQTHVDTSRLITVEFISTNNRTLPWDFYPNIHKITMHPGEMKRISFFAKNNSNQRMTVQAIPSVTPGLAAKYLKKTECFCFDQQTLESGDSLDMPVLFHLDPELPKNIRTVTLSYTMFDITNGFTQTKKTTGKIS